MPNTFAREIKCRVLDVVWMTPTVVRIRFEPSRAFDYQPGQFLSVVIPPFDKRGKTVKRCYSFASGPEEAKRNGYELCVKYVEGGVGSGFLGSLSPGDTFTAQAPYGDFVYRHPGEGRSVCFIATGTGVAPFRAAIFSKAFQANPPANATCLIGVSHESEVLYRGEIETDLVKTIHAVSKPSPVWKGFQGRVTDYLRTLPRDWPWRSTDFYLCGNGQMIGEVNVILRDGFGVPQSAIHKENFSTPKPMPTASPIRSPQLEEQRSKSLTLSLPFLPKVA